MVRLENMAVPVVSVSCVTVPPRVAAVHGGAPLKARPTVTLAMGVLVLSVTWTCTGEFVRTCPSMEFWGCVRNATFTGKTTAGAMVTV